MATWFTSDTHFGHGNIIRYCDRPFGSLGEMNHEMTRRWNEVVAPEDTVYHLGDFAMGKPEFWPGFRAGLNGSIVLIHGNHDGTKTKMLNDVGFDRVEENIVVDVDGVALWLNHYPVATPDDEPKYRLRPPALADYDIALCGHIHQYWRKRAGCVNVGVDVWGFRPISVRDILSVPDTDVAVGLVHVA
jgi:calcineurin-like phosphoesterase family protein